MDLAHEHMLMGLAEKCMLMGLTREVTLQVHDPAWAWPMTSHSWVLTHLTGLLRGPIRTLGHWAGRRDTLELGFFRIPILDKYGYPIAGYGNVCMPDDSNKAWGMLFESEAWPPPLRVK